jgi:nucleotide-binding universal stress UspA family protein
MSLAPRNAWQPGVLLAALAEKQMEGNSGMTYSKILVPTDFSESAQVALAKAYSLAQQLNASLCVLHVQDESTLRTAVGEGLLTMDSTDEDLEAGVSRLTAMRFSAMLAGLAPSDVPIETKTRRGEPGYVIVETARELGADLVVMGMNGITAASQLASLLLGSVCEHVLRNSPCPTVTVRLDHRS